MSLIRVALPSLLVLAAGCASLRDGDDQIPGAVPGATAKKEPTGLEVLSPDNLTKSTRELFHGKPNEPLARQLYQQGEQLYDEAARLLTRYRQLDAKVDAENLRGQAIAKYQEAKAKFADAQRRWPDTSLEEDAMFMIGECEFFSDRYSAADEAYGDLVKKYPNTRHMDQVSRKLFAVGYYWRQVYEKDQPYFFTPNFTDDKRPLFNLSGRAMASLRAVTQKDPTGDLSDAALMILGNAYFNDGQYEEADFHYKMVRTEYPRSKFQYEAHRMGLQAKLKLYQGADYDDTPLVEAEELVDQLLAQFPDKNGPDRDFLVTARKEIHAQKALREWNVGEFYARRGDYASARMYYVKIVKDYPTSTFAEQSRSRLEQIKTEPDFAPEPLQWATKWLPGGKTTRVADRGDGALRR